MHIHSPVQAVIIYDTAKVLLVRNNRQDRSGGTVIIKHVFELLNTQKNDCENEVVEKISYLLWDAGSAKSGVGRTI